MNRPLPPPEPFDPELAATMVHPVPFNWVIPEVYIWKGEQTQEKMANLAVVRRSRHHLDEEVPDEDKYRLIAKVVNNKFAIYAGEDIKKDRRILTVRGELFSPEDQKEMNIYCLRSDDGFVVSFERQGGISAMVRASCVPSCKYEWVWKDEIQYLVLTTLRRLRFMEEVTADPNYSVPHGTFLIPCACGLGDKCRRALTFPRKNLKQFQCDLCKGCLKSSNAIFEHIRVQHIHGGQIYCPYANCYRTFYHTSNYWTHLKECHNKIDPTNKRTGKKFMRNYPCPFCWHESKGPQAWVKHYQTCPNKDAQVRIHCKCKLCEALKQRVQENLNASGSSSGSSGSRRPVVYYTDDYDGSACGAEGYACGEVQAESAQHSDEGVDDSDDSDDEEDEDCEDESDDDEDDDEEDDDEDDDEDEDDDGDAGGECVEEAPDNCEDDEHQVDSVEEDQAENHSPTVNPPSPDITSTNQQQMASNRSSSKKSDKSSSKSTKKGTNSKNTESIHSGNAQSAPVSSMSSCRTIDTVPLHHRRLPEKPRVSTAPRQNPHASVASSTSYHINDTVPLPHSHPFVPPIKQVKSSIPQRLPPQGKTAKKCPPKQSAPAAPAYSLRPRTMVASRADPTCPEEPEQVEEECIPLMPHQIMDGPRRKMRQLAEMFAIYLDEEEECAKRKRSPKKDDLNSSQDSISPSVKPLKKRPYRDDDEGNAGAGCV